MVTDVTVHKYIEAIFTWIMPYIHFKVYREQDSSYRVISLHILLLVNLSCDLTRRCLERFPRTHSTCPSTSWALESVSCLHLWARLKSIRGAVKTCSLAEEVMKASLSAPEGE